MNSFQVKFGSSLKSKRTHDGLGILRILLKKVEAIFQKFTGTGFISFDFKIIHVS